MVTWNLTRYVTSRKIGGVYKTLFYREGECLSADTKPTEEIYNGSKLLEMDTGKIFMFDAASEAWLEWGASV